MIYNIINKINDLNLDEANFNNNILDKFNNSKLFFIIFVKIIFKYENNTNINPINFYIFFIMKNLYLSLFLL
jgi:hypothetical protein